MKTQKQDFNFRMNICILLLIGAVVTISCKTDVQKVNTVTSTNNFPNLSAKNIEIVYTDSALLKFKLEAPELNRYMEIEEPYSEFPQGLKTTFYDKNGVPESVITAEYALYLKEPELWEARNNVVAKNLKENRTLETEHLYWDQKKEILYSKNFVKITTEDEIIYGEGFESDQNFTKWKILKPKGTISMKEE